jgi:hypothetical protein
MAKGRKQATEGGPPGGGEAAGPSQTSGPWRPRSVGKASEIGMNPRLSGAEAQAAVKDALATVPVVITRIELWRTERLVPLVSNPRTHSDEQIAEIAASMREFGLALRKLRDWGSGLMLTSPIPQRMPADAPRGPHQPSLPSETRLRDILLRAGLPEFVWQHPIALGQPLGSTTPDAFFPMEDMPGLCIYVDGLSARLHGSPETAARDRHLREALRSRGYQVIEIPASHLEDRASMQRHIASVARWLLGADAAKRVVTNQEWWVSLEATDAGQRGES